MTTHTREKRRDIRLIHDAILDKMQKVKTRAGDDGTRGEGARTSMRGSHGRPGAGARGRGGTRKGNMDGTDTDRSIMVELLKYYPDCTIHVS